MALTVSNVDARSEDVFGRHRVRLSKVTFDSSYETGGESFTPADVGLSEFSAVFVSPDAASIPGYVVQYNYTTKKLQVFGVEQDADGVVTDPLDEENAAADLSSLVVRVLAIGV
jgi:hypothetical protein